MSETQIRELLKTYVPEPILNSRKSRLKAVNKGLVSAEDFQTWRSLCEEYDRLTGKDIWRQRTETRLYDYREIERRYEKLANILRRKKSHDLLFSLNEGMHGNMGGMGNPALYANSKIGTKHLIENYLDLLIEAINFIGNATDIETDEKIDFLRRANHCYGRSALFLSGAGGLIYFHHGVIASLIQQKLLPKIIGGSSGGGWASVEIGIRNDEELSADFFRDFRFEAYSKDTLVPQIISMGKEGRNLHREEVISSFCPKMTFQEAFEHSGRYINISVAPTEVHQKSRLLNAITSPNVTLRSALMATSAVPGLVEPVRLEAKNARGRVVPYLASRRWVDGAVRQDLPVRQISRLYSVNHYVVSMANPLTLLFVDDKDYAKGKGMLNHRIAKLARGVLQEGLDTCESMITKYRPSMSGTKMFIQDIESMLNQQYVGDINFVLDKDSYDMRNALFSYGDGEVERLILSGERATWPKIEMLRNAVKVGNCIEDWLFKFERHTGKQNQHMTW